MTADEAEPTRVGSALRYLTPDTTSEDDMANETTMKVRRAQGADAKKNKLEADGDGVPSLAAPEPSALEASPPPAPAAAGALRRYKVWSHGTLQRDGITYPPGAELTLPEDVAKTLGGTVTPV